MDFTTTDKIEKADEERVFQGLLAYNKERFDKADFHELGVYLKNEKGEIIAGLLGYTHGEWLQVRCLWVDEECRRKGIGKRVLAKAEETAKERGCVYSLLDTYEFQAPKFYEKYGYKPVFTMKEHSSTGTHYYLTKTL